MAGNKETSHTMDVFHHFLRLSQQELHGSVFIMGDLLLANPALLGLSSYLDQHLKILVSYSDSLCADLQYRRALHYYKEALKVKKKIEQSTEVKSDLEQSLPTEGALKWKMYKCHIHLKETQEALDVLSSIPLRQRDAKVALALGKLYHHYKNDTRCALICYKQALSMSPLAIEAILGLFSLGVSLSEVAAIAASKEGPGTTSSLLTSIIWLNEWLEAQANITRSNHNGAVVKFGQLSKMGFNMSAGMNCQLAMCMLKLGKEDTALEMFAKAHVQDPFNLKHMDTYARLLTSSKEKLERLSTSLLYASSSHPQPWMAKAWQLTRDTKLDTTTRSKAKTFALKACSLDSKNAEASFFLASLAMSKNDFHVTIQKYSETIRLDPSFFAAYEPYEILRLGSLEVSSRLSLIRCYYITRSEKEVVNVTKYASKHLTLPQQLYLEGMTLSQNMKNLPKAKLALEKAIKLDKTFEKAMLLLVDVYLLSLEPGCTERAIEVLSAHLQKYSSPALHCKLGSCYYKVKQFEKAIDHFQMALRLDSTYEKAIAQLKTVSNVLQRSRTADDVAHLESDSDLELEVIEREDVVLVGPASHSLSLEVDSDDSVQMMDLVGQGYQW